MESNRDNESLFLTHPETFQDEFENTIQIIEYGEIFQSEIMGILQWVRPFTAQVTDKSWLYVESEGKLKRMILSLYEPPADHKSSLYTEIALGYISENSQINFWGIPDYGHSKDWHLYAQIRKAMELLRLIKKLNDYTCEYCYLSLCGKKFLIDGQFFNSKTKYELEKYNEAKLAIKKRVWRRNLVVCCSIAFVIITIILISKLNWHF